MDELNSLMTVASVNTLLNSVMVVYVMRIEKRFTKLQTEVELLIAGRIYMDRRKTK